MKKLLMFGFILLTLLIGSIGSSQASLITQEVSGDNFVLDDDNNLLWYSELSSFTNKNYDEQVSAIADLGAGWRMASLSEMTTLYDELVLDSSLITMFTPSYLNGSFTYYYGRFESVPATNSHQISYWADIFGLSISSLDTRYILDDTSHDFYSAWAVRDFTSPVPEPTTMLLFCFGLLGLAGVNRRRK